MQSAVGTARAAGRHFLGPSLLRIGRGCCGLSGSARQQQLRVKSFCVGASTCDSSGSSGGHIDARQCTTRSGPCSSSTCSSNVKYACTSGSPTYCCSLASCRAPVKAEIQRSFPAGRLLGLLHRPFFCDAGNLFMSTRSAFHAAANARAPQEQQRRQRQQQHEQQQQQPEATSASVQAPLPDGVAYPADYAGLPVPSSTTRTGASKSNSDSHGAGSSSSSSSSPTVEQLGMLPAWARRRLPPRREVLFLRVLPVAPLVGMALGVHLLPPLGLGHFARDCLSALIAYTAALLTANAAVHAGMQLAELGFPPERQHRGFYTVGRLGVSLFFVVHSLLVSGLLHDEPLHGIYLCCASSLGLLGVDWLLYKKATTPIWFLAERRRLCLWVVAALGIAALSEQQTVDSTPARPLLG